MSPINYAILPFYRYFDFKGRSTRSEFWWFSLLLVLVGLLFFIISINTMPSFEDMMDPYYDDSYGFVDYLSLIWNLVIIIPSISVTVRRLHDINRTGWWEAAFIGGYCLSTILFVGAIITIAMSFFMSLDGDFNSMASSFGSAYVLIGIGLIVGLGTLIWSIIWFATPSVHQDNRFGPPAP